MNQAWIGKKIFPVMKSNISYEEAQASGDLTEYEEDDGDGDTR